MLLDIRGTQATTPASKAEIIQMLRILMSTTIVPQKDQARLTSERTQIPLVAAVAVVLLAQCRRPITPIVTLAERFNRINTPEA